MKLLAFLITFVLSSVLYIAVDKQIQKRRSKYFTPARGKALAATAYGLVVIGVAGALILRV